MFDTLKHCELLLNFVGQELAMPALTKNYGGGFKSSVLIGKSHGLRKWQMRADLISDFSTEWTVTDTEFGTVSGYEYLWKFFQRFWTNGAKPFYIRFTDKTFLAGFTEPVLSQEIFTQKLFAGEIVLEQRKVAGTWFDSSDGSTFEPMLEQILPKIYLNADTLSGATNSDVVEIIDANNQSFECSGTYPKLQVKNGKKVIRFNASSNPLLCDLAINAKHIFILASYDSSPFDAYRGLLSDSTSVDCLAGGSGTNAFFNNSIGASYEYRKNGVIFAENNQQIEAGNKLFVISVKKTDGFPFNDIQIGMQKTLTARKWRGDVRKVLIYDQILPSALELRAIEWLKYERDV